MSKKEAVKILQKLSEQRNPIFYVKNTKEQVHVVSWESSYYEDRDEVKITATIRFISEYPCMKALKKVGAHSQPLDPYGIHTHTYSGHPVQEMPERKIYTAKVDLKACLSIVPFDTPAAHVLFSKK